MILKKASIFLFFIFSFQIFKLYPATDSDEGIEKDVAFDENELRNLAIAAAAAAADAVSSEPLSYKSSKTKGIEKDPSFDEEELRNLAIAAAAAAADAVSSEPLSHKASKAARKDKKR